MPMTTIQDGVAGTNIAEVNASNAVKVFMASAVTGTVGNAEKVTIFGVTTGQVARVDSTGSLIQAAADSLGFYIENQSEVLLVGVTATTTQTVTSSIQTNLNNTGALLYLIVSSTVTTTVRISIQTTCDFLSRMVILASLSLDGLTSGNTPTVINLGPNVGANAANAIQSLLPRTFSAIVSITCSTSNTFTPSIALGMKRTL